ncbi:hypothetical protein DPEC_G00083240, partial [Dallia pectoralis]
CNENSSLLLHHGRVKCPSYAHFRISPKVVGHPGTFRILFFEYYDFGHTTLFAYCFSHTIKYGSTRFRMQT